jgi:hypothetical protein
MYYGGKVNGAPFFTQAAPFGPVLPTQQNSQPWLDWPVVGLVISEYVPWFSPGCGHSIKQFDIIREYDYTKGESCALVTCRVCNYVQSVIYDFEEWLNPIQYAIIIS